MRKKLLRLFVFACVSGLLMIPAFGLAQRGVVGDPTQQGGKGGKKGKGGGGDVQPGAFDRQQQFIQGAQGGQFGAFCQGGAGQFGGFGQGGKGGKGGKGGTTMIGGMNFDLNKVFDTLANGQDSVQISKFGALSVQLQQYARDNGNTSGYINRQQFNGFAQGFLPSLQAALGGGAGGKGKGKGGDPDAVAAQRFKSADKNSDGFLSPDEMSAQLRDSGVWKKYDKDGNTVLNLDEYKAYWRDQSAATQGFGIAGGKGNQALNAAMMIIEEEWDQRPVVFRTGKLPKEIPAWFIQLDVDRDAQVGLYEWKSSQKQFYEFQVMDRNGDSLLTAEEVLWHLKALASIGGPGMTTAAYSQGMGFQDSNFSFGKAGGKKGGGKKGGGDFNFGGGGFGGGGGGGKKGGGDFNFGGGGGGGGKKGGGDFNFNFGGGGDPNFGGGGGKKGGGKKGGGGGDF